MKIALTEIWNLAGIINPQEVGWNFNLKAGPVLIEDVSQETLKLIKSDPEYDTEILPSIFTFREILWQPDVFKEAAKSLPGLRILSAFCEETNEYLAAEPSPTNTIYIQLISGIATCCQKAIQRIEKKKENTTRTLGLFRMEALPIIKFFVFHPQNRLDYYKDAVNRLNYAVKIMLTEFHGRYTQLEDPFWVVIFDKDKKIPKTNVPISKTPLKDEGNL